MFYIYAVRKYGVTYTQQFTNFADARTKSLWLIEQGFTVEIKAGSLYV